MDFVAKICSGQGLATEIVFRCDRSGNHPGRNLRGPVDRGSWNVVTASMLRVELLDPLLVEPRGTVRLALGAAFFPAPSV